MRIVVIGGTGLIGSKVVAKLTEQGHEAVAASPNTGVNALTGEGLADVLIDTDVVVDVSNSPSFADDDVMRFFTTSTTNLLASEENARVGHHVALSVVGTERIPESGYLRAKLAQEDLIEQSGIPYSLVHATQFYEFVKSIADSATTDGEVRLPDALMQPIAAEDVATVVARIAAGTPLNGELEIGGPDQVTMDEFVRNGLAAMGDERTVITDPGARYFGAHITGTELVPGDGAELFPTRYEDWAQSSPAKR